jgi:two-component system sensor histidine kinase/response regulator
MTEPTQAPGRILVVDDQPANLRVVGALLTRNGYDVAVASTGPEALQKALQQVPDLLLLDMMMPGMDGFALLAEIRRHDVLQAMPVVFLTAAQDRDLLLRAFDAGAVDYVTKPFMPEELMARVNAHIGLKLARDDLARIARERQELVNLVAHDLKNPLSSVLFASDVLLQNGCKPERIPRYLQMIHDSASDAIGYIRRYLEGQAHAHAAQQRAATSLREVHDWLVERYELQLENRGIRLVSRMGDGDAHVAIDGLVLRQVAENLVGNAMKYAADGGELAIDVRPGTAGSWQLLVEDRGDGIPATRRHELFKPFKRLHGGKDDGLSNGLGLSLARQIILNAGGDLRYEERDGGGARFVVELPAAANT